MDRMSEEQNRKNRERRDRYVRRVQAYKESVGCTDCGESFPHYVLQFDHLPGTQKVGSPGNLVRRYAWATVQAEMDKCEVVCANCHSIRSYERGQTQHKKY